MVKVSPADLMLFARFLQCDNTMKCIKRMIKLSGLLLIFSLIMITSQASAEPNVINSVLVGSPQKSQNNRPAAKGHNYGEFVRGWHDWYHAIVNKPFNLHVNDVFIGKLILSRDNRLEISTPVSDNMMTRVTFGNRGVSDLHDTGRPNLGLGITTRMRNGLSFDSSVNFDLSDTSDVTFLLTLPAIRF